MKDAFPLSVLLAGLAITGAGCGMSTDECVALPCAMPLAVEVSVTAAGGGPVEGVTVRVSGAVTGNAACSAGPTATTCYVPGVAGTYNLEIMASGFQSALRTATASGTTPDCGCPTVERVHLDIAMSRNP